MIHLPKEIQELVEQHNTARKFNNFLFENKDCHDLFKKEFCEPHQDRFIFVIMQNKIEKELNPIVHDLYHGRECQAEDKRPNQTVKGKIKHELTRTFIDQNNVKRVTTNGVRVNKDGTISLWIDTGDPHTSHLYKSSVITLI